MASDRLKARVGDIELRSPLIAASGTVGSVWEWAEVADGLSDLPHLRAAFASGELSLDKTAAAVRLVQMFPMEGIVPEMVARYNAISRHEMEDVRDFIILHYHANARDEPLWRECREMSVPDSLVERIALFRERAHVWQDEDDLFRPDSWLHVMLGQGIVPHQFHPLALALPDGEIRRLFEAVRRPIRNAVQAMPPHPEFIRHYCPADASVWSAPGSAAKAGA